MIILFLFRTHRGLLVFVAMINAIGMANKYLPERRFSRSFRKLRSFF
jgi:hypothetical protein